MRQKHQQYLSAMGIDVWTKRNGPECDDTFNKNAANDKTASKILSPISPSAADWEILEKNVTSCKKCALYKTRTQTVFGVGNRNAEIMMIGEAPGANEDLQGEPFVGRAGMLLNAMLQAIGLERKQIYIANILKCRPPNNRDPNSDEVSSCTPFLEQQIAFISPKLIVAVGRIAAQFLLNTSETMSHLRGKQFNYGTLKIPLLVIYHPAYLLRSPREKSKAYLDMLQIQKCLSA